jgi:peptidyl-prolyl cis-trans isomerase SurA
MKKVLAFILMIVSFYTLKAQDNSEVLLKIDNREITADEFLRIYNKNSSITLEEKKSVDEYLDLFINYKLKVIEAENMGYDTMSTFIKEMDGYRKQLGKPYLDKSSSIDSFILEAYQHYIEEVNASHILLKLNARALPKDSARVYNRLMEIREEIVKGKSWQQVIDENSSNPENKIGGDLGWFSAFRMVYPFEAAAYNTPVGQVSMPVRTNFGYHLIKVNGRRPNRGEANIRHIMTNLPSNPTDAEVEAAKQKIENAYEALQQGAGWDSIARAYSEHKSTFALGGKLGWMKSGTAPEVMLDTCFKLKPGQYSKPFRSEYGFHIVRVDEVKGLQSYEDMKEELANKIRQTGEIVSITHDQRIDKIKSRYGFAFYEDKLDALYQIIDTNLYNGTWDPSLAKDLRGVIFHIGDSTYTQYDAARYIAAKRLTYRGVTLQESIRKKTMEFLEERVLAYEIAQLPIKYPEYRYLLEEYHDGILLFNLTEDMVWQKAVQDTVGLKNFYDQLPEKYNWKERVVLSKYIFADSTLTDQLLKVAKKRVKKGLDSKAVSAMVCGQDSLPCVKISELKYEKGDNALADGMSWKKGAYLISRDKDARVLYYVEGILPPQMKKLSDARGLYTADYQAYLEKLWVNNLREKYPVDINEQVLSKIKEQESQN